MKIRINFIIFSICSLFIIFSFVPAIYEYLNKENIPTDRFFVLEHNYNFDYNFYLSRIRQGMEGKWFVQEKYYNHPHQSSLFQIVYLYLGKAGGILGLSVPFVYHVSRFIFGLLLLISIAKYGGRFFKGKQLILFLLLAITAGSWPILVKAGSGFRFATHMGWWSVIDSLQRLTIMPHILIGQTFLVYILSNFSGFLYLSYKKSISLGISGLIAGIIFPPTMIVVYMYLLVFGVFEILDLFSLRISFIEKKKRIFQFILNNTGKIFIFVFITIPAFLYLQSGISRQPWRALALFDIEHRFIMPYKEYALALGPVLILGLAGLFLVFIKSKREYYSPVVWILAIGLLFLIFENVPEQSPLRFTEGLIHVPLAILATFLISNIWKIKRVRFLSGIITSAVIVTGLLVMLSMVFWLTDQAYSKRFGSWRVPLGAQLVYPLDDFMEGIFYLRDNTDLNSVVLGYITSGNYIPAYAGNFVYIGHANTPDEDKKEVIAASFFKREMTTPGARDFLRKERISYIFYGPQEKEMGKVTDLKTIYEFLIPVYSNNEVIIYKIT